MKLLLMWFGLGIVTLIIWHIIAITVSVYFGTPLNESKVNLIMAVVAMHIAHISIKGNKK